ncbi:MAG TPA: pre-peptidase C-terminal domain-containing protein [Longimicrobiales bacterium]|nr:pre-peptidase C-terminal domain-containing protein [Longimicrobiales bacterium]
MSAQRLVLAPALLVLTATLATPAGSLAQGTSAFSLLPTDGRSLSIGSEETGALSTADVRSADDSYVEAWELAGRSGQSVTIDLVSDAFDARLYVVGPGLPETLSDDDGGDGCNARLTFTPLETGTFRVVASSSGSRETGTYTIRVSDRPGPPPTHGCGEVDPGALESLPTEGRALGMGSVVTGRLGLGSPTVQDGRPAEAWQLDGRAGERVSIVLESDDFDSYLYLAGPGLDGVQTDDDGAGDLDSLIEITLPTDGSYRVIAAALSAGSSGAYTLRVEEPLDLGTLATDGRSIDLGQRIEGQLRSSDPVLVEGRRGQVWGLSGVAGQRLVIDLMAEDFDAYLYLAGPGLDEPLSDDDGGDGLDSQISVTLPESGTYRVIVSSLSDGTGAFTLSVARQ